MRSKSLRAQIDWRRGTGKDGCRHSAQRSVGRPTAAANQQLEVHRGDKIMRRPRLRGLLQYRLSRVENLADRPGQTPQTTPQTLIVSVSLSARQRQSETLVPGRARLAAAVRPTGGAPTTLDGVAGPAAP